MKKILYFLCLLPLLATGQNLKINEIMVKNVSSYYDEGYNFSAWVEVYNTGAATENLQDYTFSRTTKTGVKTWTPGSISVPAGGYAVVFFERQDSVYYMAEPRTANGSTKTDYYNEAYLKSHASFKLDNPSGENTGEIILLRGDAQIDKVTYPQQYRNISYGRTTDGGATFAFFTEPSPAATNAGKASVATAAPADLVTAAPVFDVAPGYYNAAQNVSLSSSTAGAVIYYETFTGPTKTQTTDARRGKDPTTASTEYSSAITVDNDDENKAVVIRAFAVAPGKLPSEIVTGTYLVNTHATNLPTISLTIDEKYLYDAEEGMYDPAGNGNHRVFRVHDGAITSSGGSVVEDCNLRGNFGNPWDRPANFEYFDKNGVRHISQEVDLGIAGQCTRQNNWFKSLKVKAKDKFGNDKLEYDFFASKPGHKYESVMLRWAGTEGSGTINGASWLRDAFMAEMSIGFMEVDVQAYQPAAIYVNGEYWGMTNVRERTNDSNVYSSYGISGSDVYVLENDEVSYPAPGPIAGNKTIPYEPYEKKKAFDAMKNSIVGQDLSDPAKYAAACELLDIDSYIDDLILSVYGQNWDWPQNNLKMWRPVAEGGKWRYFSYDQDFSINNGDFLCGGFRTFAMVKNASGGCGNTLSALAGQMLTSFLANPEFKARFLTRVQFHTQNTFEPTRLTTMLDSLKAQISQEAPRMVAYRAVTDNWQTTIDNVIRPFVTTRAATLLSEAKSLIGGTINTISLSTNLPSEEYVTLTLNNVPRRTNSLLAYDIAAGLPFTVKAGKVAGYEFQGWYEFPDDTLIAKGASEWKYWYKSSTPGDWTADGYAETSWSNAIAPVGFGAHGSGTSVSGYGIVTTKLSTSGTTHYPTVYYRKTFNVTNLESKNNFSVNLLADDGAVVYVNGTEVYRLGFPSDYDVTHCSLTNAGNAAAVTFFVPQSLIKEGENVIQVEVHQWDGGSEASEAANCLSSSNDSYFDLSLTCKSSDLNNAIEYATTQEWSSTASGPLALTAYYTPCQTCATRKISINEVYSAGSPSNEDADWIELYNIEYESADISGYTITRINDAALKATYVIPDGTIIPARGFVVLDREDYGFGISHNEDYTLILTDIYENDIDRFVVDAATLTTTYGESTGRKPDGYGNIVIISNEKVSRGAWNEPETNIKLISGNETLKVYPNPVKEFVNIEAGSAIRNIVITDIAGRTLLQTTGNGLTQTVVPTQTLSGGVYILTVETENGKGISRILK